MHLCQKKRVVQNCVSRHCIISKETEKEMQVFQACMVVLVELFFFGTAK